MIASLSTLFAAVALFDPSSGQTAVYGDWISGRSTFYSEIDSGACSYQTISTSSFPYGYIAAPNEAFWDDSRSCGECYEVQCLDDWDGVTSGCCNTDGNGNNVTVTIQITDVCPVSDNTEWCSGDIVHFDLSEAAFDYIADTTCGVISMKYRRVSCDFTSNIIIRNKDGINAWWHSIFVENVAGYGKVDKVELKDSSDSATWVEGETTEYNGYEFSSSAASGWELPYSIRVYDSAGNNVTSIDLITDRTENKEFDFGTNFDISLNDSTTDDSGSSSSSSSSSSGGNSDGASTILIHHITQIFSLSTVIFVLTNHL